MAEQRNKLQGFQARSIAGGTVLAVEACSDFHFSKHTHDEYGIGVLLEGAQKSRSGRGPVEARAGDVITVNPNEMHDGAPIDGPRRWAMLYIRPEDFAERILDLSEGRSQDFEFNAPVIADLPLAHMFRSTYTALVSREAELGNEGLTLLLGVLCNLTKQRVGAPRGALHRVKQMIDDEPNNQHTLEQLAQVAGISRFRLLRAFRGLTGLTPHAYLVQRRLQNARAIIRQSGLLADAAIASGFSDQSHFHRTFVRTYGLTPGAYAAAVA